MPHKDTIPVLPGIESQSFSLAFPNRSVQLQNQHFVPQLLLRNFVDGDGRLFYLDKQTDQLGRVAPKKAASKTDFYEFNIDGAQVSFENRFQKHETRAGRALQKLTNGISPLDLSSDERRDLSTFIALQSFRTEAFLANLQGQQAREHRGKVLERLWDSLSLISAMVADRYWILMEARDENYFYLGDNPVVLQHIENPSLDKPLGFDVIGVEAFMPITPKIAIYLPCRSFIDQLIDSHRYGLKRQRELWTTGQGMSVDAMAIGKALNGTKPLHDAAVFGTPIAAVPDHVLNLNYLQCSWAHQQIFSNRRDFTTARMIFDKTPQYRTPPKSAYSNLFPI